MVEESSPEMWFWFVPVMDASTIFSIVVGIIVSGITFYIGYRQTIGARDERLRAANLSLANAVLRRIAVERETMPLQHFDSIKRATAYRGVVPVTRLHQFGQSLDIALHDTLGSDFLDNNSKNAVLELIDKSRDTEPLPNPSNGLENYNKVEVSSRLLAAAGLLMTSLAVGAGATAFLTSETARRNQDVLPGDASQYRDIFVTVVVIATIGIIISGVVTVFDQTLVRVSAKRDQSGDNLRKKAKQALSVPTSRPPSA